MGGKRPCSTAHGHLSMGLEPATFRSQAERFSPAEPLANKSETQVMFGTSPNHRAVPGPAYTKLANHNNECDKYCLVTHDEEQTPPISHL